MNVTPYDPNDTEHQEGTLEAVTPHGDGWTLKHDGWSLYVGAGPITPEAGMTARFYGKGIGYTVRGVVIDGHTFYYRTAEEEERRHAEWVADLKRERAEEYEKTKNDMQRRLEVYPEPFRKRIERFLHNAPDTAWEYQGYEMAVCDAALAILEVYKSAAELDAWRESNYRPDLPGLGEMGLSGNQHGMAVRLAYWGLTQAENVWKEHAAISPLVGCEEAGCVPVGNEVVA